MTYYKYQRYGMIAILFGFYGIAGMIINPVINGISGLFLISIPIFNLIWSWVVAHAVGWKLFEGSLWIC